MTREELLAGMPFYGLIGTHTWYTYKPCLSFEYGSIAEHFEDKREYHCNVKKVTKTHLHLFRSLMGTTAYVTVPLKKLTLLPKLETN